MIPRRVQENPSSFLNPNIQEEIINPIFNKFLVPSDMLPKQLYDCLSV